MASLQASRMQLSGSSWSSSSSSSSYHGRGLVRATINVPKIQISPLSLPKFSNTRDLMEEVNLRGGYYNIPTTNSTLQLEKDFTSARHRTSNSDGDLVIAKLCAIMEEAADRVEMHNNIGQQRDNWNNLLLTSINAITLSAATMSGIAALGSGGPSTALKISSVILYLAATGMLAVMNKLQPSQLAEEQRNAARLFKQLHGQIHTMISIGNPTTCDVNEVIQKVLALDKAYPLPLLGAMLEKFPSNAEPAVWWPKQKPKQAKGLGRKMKKNGWSEELEHEMREIAGVVKRNDKADYLRLAKKALKLNKALAISGPVLTLLGAIGSALVGNNSMAVIVGVAAGALASAVNTLQHGGQVGMVFEMYRSNAGFFKLMEETIDTNVGESLVERRENGEVLELKVALQLGRSLSELRHLAAASSDREGATEEFASKLF